MKTIDYAQNHNTFIISDYHNTGSIKIFQDGMLIYNSIPELNNERTRNFISCFYGKIISVFKFRFWS